MKNFIFGAFLGLLCGICFATLNENESDNVDASAITALASIETPTEEVAPEIEEVVPEPKPVVTHKPKKQHFPLQIYKSSRIFCFSFGYFKELYDNCITKLVIK